MEIDLTNLKLHIETLRRNEAPLEDLWPAWEEITRVLKYRKCSLEDLGTTEEELEQIMRQLRLKKATSILKNIQNCDSPDRRSASEFLEMIENGQVTLDELGLTESELAEIRNKILDNEAE